MKPYGYEHEIRGVRGDYMDVGDIAELGMPSRFGKQSTKVRKTTRKFYKKAARKTAKNAVNAWRDEDNSNS